MYKDRLLTNGEHDQLWREAYKSIPDIRNSLKFQNLLFALKELHEAGDLAHESYVKMIRKVIDMEGFVFK